MLRSTKLFHALKAPLVRARSTVAQSVTQSSVNATKESYQEQVCIGKMMNKLHSDKLSSDKSPKHFDLKLFQKQSFAITFHAPHIQTEASPKMRFGGESMTGC